VPLQVGLSAGPGCKVESVKVTELFAFDAMGKTSVEEASAGDIVTFAGIENFNIGDTVVDFSEPRPLEPITVEQPTMSMTFGVNKSAVAGKAGKKLTMRVIKDRLEKARARVRRVSLGLGSPIHPEAAGPRPKVGAWRTVALAPAPAPRSARLMGTYNTRMTHAGAGDQRGT
jgi:hypothetical protein